MRLYGKEVNNMNDIKVSEFDQDVELDMEIQKCDPNNCNYDCKPYADGKCDSFYTTMF